MNLKEDAEDFGIDWDGPSIIEDVESVEVPVVQCPLQSQQLAILRSHIDPLSDCTDFGVGLYLATREIIVACSSISDSM